MVTVLENNGGALRLASGLICTNRRKHLDVWRHFVREKVDEKTIQLVHVSSADQSADDLTKNILAEALVKHRRTLLQEWACW